MPEANLFEIYAADEFHTTVAEPSEWLKSLPAEEQIEKIRHYLADLQGEYDQVADSQERSRIAVLMGAARRHLTSLEGHGPRPSSTGQAG
ncbi:MAG: hypothetical protein M3Z21_11830 [Pseudomonadota bacterium]|nr:hypothetical protein [Pseudomonadota bacterium]